MAKIYVSTDMEGIAETRRWSDVNATSIEYPKFQLIQSNELKQIVDIAGPQNNFMIRDAHGRAKNVIPNLFPDNVDFIQYWDTDPINMMRGINQDKYDFAILHGYHSAGGHDTSPLAHTFSLNSFKKFTLNGNIVGETTFAIYTAAYFNVPVIYIVGDAGAIHEAHAINPNIIGTITKSFTPQDECILSSDVVQKNIQTDFQTAQKHWYKDAHLFDIKLPEVFTLTIEYNDKTQATRHAQRLLQCKLISPNTLEYTTDDFYNMLCVMRQMKLPIQTLPEKLYKKIIRHLKH